MPPMELEAWSSRTFELDAELVPAVTSAGLVRVAPDLPPRRWRLEADARVGVVAGRDWELRVTPHLAIPRLMFLLGYAADPKGWRTTTAPFDVDDALFPAVASGFALHAERALSPAPARGYTTVDERATVMRGRLRVADQVARWPGLPLPLELSYDEHAVDIPENRLVRGAAELLLRFPRVPVAARKRLLRVRAALADARPALPSSTIVAPPITRLNDQYRAVLPLATLILRSASVTTTGANVMSSAFVFDMNKVFEDFLAAALGGALARFGGQVSLQHDEARLDHEGRIRLRPDITWWRDGVCRAVVDAKYKALAPRSAPNADVYQMLAYAMGLGLRRGHLVYAKDSGEQARRHRVRHADVTIDVAVIDVERPPDVVLARIERLAREIAAGASGRDRAA